MAKQLSSPDKLAASSEEIARFRLARHHLLEVTSSEAATVARDICGCQAQLMAAAYLQFSARNHEIKRSAIESALWVKRSLVKTSLMRQTLHLIPADAFPVYIAALRSSRSKAALRIMARFNIGREEADDLTRFIMDALAARPLRQPAIRAAVLPKVSKRMRAWMEKVWSILRIPIAEGLICYGPGEGNEATFIHTTQWLGKKIPVVSEEKARLDLLRSYLGAYGPATLTDFAHWSGMPAGEVRPLPALLGEELVEVNVENRPSLLLRADLRALKAAGESSHSVRLLPHFDPYLLAHREKDHLLEKQYYKQVYRNQGWISPVLLVGGRIAGTWSYKLQGKRLQVAIHPFRSIPRGLRPTILREAQRLSSFFGSSLDLSF